MHERELFHPGERRAQALAGEEAGAAHNGRAIGARIVPGALPFVAAQSLVLLATRDATGWPWVSAALGPPGFATATADAVRLDLAAARVPADAPWVEHLARDPALGLLFLEPLTRRRLRVNGRGATSGRVLTQTVREAFPNCPQYVRRRALVLRPREDPLPTRGGARLEDGHLAWIERTDAFFLASAHRERGPDASHRGGAPGFVQVLAADRLRVPDYAGNSMFMTLGNLLEDPRAGLLFLDLARGVQLQVQGRVTIDWQVPAAEDRGGTGRAWSLEVEGWLESGLAFAAEVTDLDLWPRNPPP